MKHLIILFLGIFGFLQSIAQESNFHYFDDIPQYPVNNQVENENKATIQKGVLVKNLTNHRNLSPIVHCGKENWIPVDSDKKRTLCGTMNKFGAFNKSLDPEDDWNIYVKPDDNHQAMIDDAILLRAGLWRNGYKSAGSVGLNRNLGQNSLMFWWPEGFGTSNTIPSREQIEIEGEITPKESLRQSGNPWGFRGLMTGERTNQSLCMYGAFVVEERHNYRPEIHPCEAIWWKKNGSYYLFSSHDESNRFSRYQTSYLEHEWRIPFEFDPSQKKILYTIEILGAKNPVAINASYNYPDLKIENKSKISVQLQSGVNQAYGMALSSSFENVSRTTNGRVKGELVLRTKTGRPQNSGAAKYGQFFFKLTARKIDDRTQFVSKSAILEDRRNRKCQTVLRNGMADDVLGTWSLKDNNHFPYNKIIISKNGSIFKASFIPTTRIINGKKVSSGYKNFTANMAFTASSSLPGFVGTATLNNKRIRVFIPTKYFCDEMNTFHGQTMITPLFENYPSITVEVKNLYVGKKHTHNLIFEKELSSVEKLNLSKKKRKPTKNSRKDIHKRPTLPRSTKIKR